MRTEAITFPGAGGVPLAARLEWPEGAPLGVALFAHCFTCGKDSSAVVRIARALAARSIATLRFDFTGLGGSGGDFANTDFTSNVADLVAAADHLRATQMAPGLLIGHSLGGAAVIAAAARIPEARAVVTIGAPGDPAHVTQHFDHAVAAIEAEGAAEIVLGGRRLRIARAFLDDVRAQSLAQHLGALRRALLVLHSPRDAVVGIGNATQIFMAAKHPKSFVSLDDADHFLSRPEDAQYAAGLIAAWAARFLARAAEPARVPDAPDGEGRSP